MILCLILGSDDAIQNGQQDFVIYWGTMSVNMEHVPKFTKGMSTSHC